MKKFCVLASFMIVLAILIGGSGVTPAFAETIELTYWDWYVTQGPAVDAGIAEFEQRNPDIKIKKTTQVVTEYPNMINMAFQSGDAPDVFVIPKGVTAQQAIEADWIYPISEFQDFPEFKASFPDPDASFMEGINVIDGKTYTAPFAVSLPWLQLYINGSLYKEAGLLNADGSYKFPKTWDEMIENSRIIKEKTGKYGIGWGGTTNNIDWFWAACQFSAPYIAVRGVPLLHSFDPRTNQYTFSTNPTYRAMIDKLLIMRDEDLILPETLSIDDETARIKFATGEIAHYFGGVWVINGWTKTNPEFTEYTLGPAPLIDADKRMSSFYNLVARSTDIWYINAQSKNLEAAWKFYKYLFSNDFANIWAKEGNGKALMTTLPTEEYAATDAWQAYYAMGDLLIPGPDVSIRNSGAAKLQPTLQGPNPAAVLTGIYTGQIEDIDAALKDLDTRYEATLDLAIKDAQAAGVEIAREDFLFEDWNPLKPYVTTPKQ